MSYFNDDENSNFSIFKKNFTSNRINQIGGSSSSKSEPIINRSKLLHLYLDYYNNKSYVSNNKRIEAIKKDMQSLKKENCRIYLDDNGNVINTSDNLLNVNDFIGGNIEKYDIIAKNPKLQHLGIDGFNEGTEINMGKILGLDDYNNVILISEGEKKNNKGELYRDMASKQYKKRQEVGFTCKDGRVVSKLHHCLPKLRPLPNIEGISSNNISKKHSVKQINSSRNSSPLMSSSRKSSRNISPLMSISRNSSRKSSRKSSRQSSRKSSPLISSSRKSSRHSSRNSSRNSSPLISSSRKSSRHSSRKSSRNSSPLISSSRKSSRHSSRNSSRNSSRTSSLHSPQISPSHSGGCNSPINFIGSSGSNSRNSSRSNSRNSSRSNSRNSSRSNSIKSDSPILVNNNFNDELLINLINNDNNNNINFLEDDGNISPISYNIS